MVPFLELVWTGGASTIGEGFGYSVASAGDVNGDGFDDVIGGAPSYDSFAGTSVGRAYAFHGSATWPETAPAWMVEGDTAGEAFGFSVASAGDVNDDGYDDVVVGANEYWVGGAFLFQGSATGLQTVPAWTSESDQEGASYGHSVASAGDVNGDDFDDVIVGSPGYANGQEEEGGAFVYLGSSDGLESTAAWTAESDQEDAWFGWDVSTAGDVNADGFDDVIVGAQDYDAGLEQTGRAYLYVGSATGPSSAPTWTAESDQAYAHFGESVSTAGDVNGDGFDDVVVGEPNYVNGEIEEGRASVFLGHATRLAAKASWTAESNNVSASFGDDVASAGDVNADGYSDVLVGAYEYDYGRAYLYVGSPTGPVSPEAWIDEPAERNAHVGWSVQTAGDVNADGYADILVADPDYQASGRVDLYRGGCYDPTDTDADSIGDACDLCPDHADAGQEDDDADGIGDACDPCRLGAVDSDGDGICVPEDCDDSDATVFPGAPQVCDGLDNTCSGAIPADELDADSDGEPQCAGDCDDGDPTRSPSSPELCNDVDDDCDGRVGPDEVDADGDLLDACSGDCDDADSRVNPSLIEVCDDVDNDCDGAVDEACAPASDSTGCGACAGAGRVPTDWASLAGMLAMVLRLRRR